MLLKLTSRDSDFGHEICSDYLINFASGWVLLKGFFHLFIHLLLGLSKGNARVEILFFSLVYLLKVVELAVSDREIWELVKSNYAWIILFYDCTSINHGVENDHCVLWFQLRKWPKIRGERERYFSSVEIRIIFVYG